MARADQVQSSLNTAAKEHRPAWMTLSAFAIIYFVWGSTFLAIRVGVHEVPPLLFAAMRFLTAGILLFGWTIARREQSPNLRQWISVFLLAFLIFVVDYGLLFWAEQRVPSGIAAVMMAVIPAFMALFEIIFLRTQRLTIRLCVALLIGFAGVAVLMSHSFNLGSAAIDTVGAVALIVASISWAIASVLSRKLAASRVKSDEFGSADACRRCDADALRRRAGGVPQFPSRNGLKPRMVLAVLSHRRRIHHWLHRVRMADPS